MNRKIKKIMTENKKLIFKLGIAFILCIAVSIALEIAIFKNMYQNMTFDRCLIISCVLYFISIHFIIPLKKLYDFIYRKRYIIAVILLLAIVILGYSGSSINMYDIYIASDGSDNTEVLGKSRSIRSDEWAVNTPLSFSQNMDNDKILPYNSSIVRGTDTDMFTVIHAPVLDIVTIGKPFTIGYLFGNTIGLSFWWYGRLIALMLVSFEFCMIITNKKKLISLCGMLIISLAPAVQWWYSNFLPDLLIFGQLAIIMIVKFIEATKLKVKIFTAIGFAISSLGYIFSFYPAWIISLGYVFLAIFIWVIYQHRKIYKINKKDILIICFTIIFVGLIGLRYYLLSSDTLNAVMNTSYPGDRFELGGNGIENIFGYVYNIFMPYKDISNASKFSAMISFYPVPAIIALIYMIRNKKGYSFIIPLLVVTGLFTIWTFISTNELFAKVTLLYLVTAKRITIPLGLIQSYLIIYLLANVQKNDKILGQKTSGILAFFTTITVLYIAIKQIPSDYMGALIGCIAGIMLVVAFYLLYNLNEKNKNSLISLLMVIAIIGGITVNPIIKGTDTIYEKPLAKKVQEIVSKDKNALWVVEGYGFPIPNYLVANGAKTINSTNYYPNEDMIETIVGEQKENIKEIWNRYAHITINLVKDETNFVVTRSDCYTINLNYKKLRDLNVKYILSIRELVEFSDEEISLQEQYRQTGMYLYEIKKIK